MFDLKFESGLNFVVKYINKRCCIHRYLVQFAKSSQIFPVMPDMAYNKEQKHFIGFYDLFVNK